MRKCDEAANRKHKLSTARLDYLATLTCSCSLCIKAVFEIVGSRVRWCLARQRKYSSSASVNRYLPLFIIWRLVAGGGVGGRDAVGSSSFSTIGLVDADLSFFVAFLSVEDFEGVPFDFLLSGEDLRFATLDRCANDTGVSTLIEKVL